MPDWFVYLVMWIIAAIYVATIRSITKYDFTRLAHGMAALVGTSIAYLAAFILAILLALD